MNIVQIRVCGRFKLEKKLFDGKNVQNMDPVFIKMEHIRIFQPKLLVQGKLIQNLQGGIGIPNMHWCGHQQEYNIIVYQKLGKSLKELLYNHGQFSLKTTLMIGLRILNIIQYLHYKNILYRNVKLQSFMFGIKQKMNKLYITGFSHAEKVENYIYEEYKDISVLSTFTSINVIKGNKQYSKRDDMISIAYLIIHLIKKLPWNYCQNQQYYTALQKLCQQHQSVSIQNLCSGIPKQFKLFLEYCLNLDIKQRIDYFYLQNIMKQRFIKQGYIFDQIYDWMLIPFQEEKNKGKINIPISIEIIQNENDFIQKQYKNYKKNNINNKLKNQKQIYQKQKNCNIY